MNPDTYYMGNTVRSIELPCIHLTNTPTSKSNA
jgi:hypothetical protein